MYLYKIKICTLKILSSDWTWLLETQLKLLLFAEGAGLLNPGFRRVNTISYAAIFLYKAQASAFPIGKQAHQMLGKVT
jgi:hypothetical protein